MNYKELKQLIQKHNKAYYDLSAPTITDSEYDQLYDRLEAIEIAQGWRDHDSPTTRVGGAAGKVSHPYKLYSLRKVYDEDEIDSFMTVKLLSSRFSLSLSRPRAFFFQSAQGRTTVLKMIKLSL